MATLPPRVLRNLRNTRDLRAELINLAAELAANTDATVLRVEQPAISEQTVRDEWTRLLAALKPGIAKRMRLELVTLEAVATDPDLSRLKAGANVHGRIPIDRPNYRAEVLRLLIGASLANDGMWSVKTLIKQIGASQTPVRQALRDLKRAGVLHDWRNGGMDLVPEDLSAELLAKVQAAPQTLRFRFERGSRIRTPVDLLDRAMPLLGSSYGGPWGRMALSGTPVAQAQEPALDLAGAPRLDLVAFISREEKTFDPEILRKLSDGLEPEPNVLAATPVVVTLVRADDHAIQDGVIPGVRCAPAMDVFLSLLDMNLRRQAVQYAKAIRL
jgi:hypothetical protein